METSMWLRLAGMVIVVYLAYKFGDSNARADLQERQKSIDITYKNAMACEERNKALIKKLQDEREYSEKLAQTRLTRYRNILNKILEDKSQEYPWLAAQLADVLRISDVETAIELRKKSRPAIKAAEKVAEIAKEKRVLQMENRMLQYQINYYESLFPWLEEFKEVPPKDGWQYTHEIVEEANEYEQLRNWLSPEEYRTLHTFEKYQLALDRYIKRKKSQWEIGIEYERYIGFLCEQSGYTVRYFGALKEKADMGRDLILEKGKDIIIIQCKRWAKEKIIHENHVFQLAGTTYEYQFENPEKVVKGVFVTTTAFSPVAVHCAELLGITLYPNVPFQEYPRIKCNVGKDKDGGLSKIYHLPMDQQYDRVQIAGKKNTMFAWTVKEAEENGFRRAYRWHPNK